MGDKKPAMKQKSSKEESKSQTKQPREDSASASFSVSVPDPIRSTPSTSSLESGFECLDTTRERLETTDLGITKPQQPKLTSYPMDKNNRSFRSEWYGSFAWLEYSVKSKSNLTVHSIAV